MDEKQINFMLNEFFKVDTDLVEYEMISGGSNKKNISENVKFDFPTHPTHNKDNNLQKRSKSR